MKAGWSGRATNGETGADFAPVRQNSASMDQQTVRKTYKYKLTPAPQQEQLLDRTLMLCRHVYNAARGERQEAWRMRGRAVTSSQQTAELPGRKEAMPEDGEVHPQVVPDVVLRVVLRVANGLKVLQAGSLHAYLAYVIALVVWLVLLVWLRG